MVGKKINSLDNILNDIVEKAFKEGVIWKTNGINEMKDAIKEAQYKILRKPS